MNKNKYTIAQILPALNTGGVERGVVETYDMSPETALVKMMWLSKHHQENVRTMMGENLVGEISDSRKLI